MRVDDLVKFARSNQSKKNVYTFQNLTKMYGEVFNCKRSLDNKQSYIFFSLEFVEPRKRNRENRRAETLSLHLFELKLYRPLLCR